MEIIRQRFTENIPSRYNVTDDRLYFQWAISLRSAVVDLRANNYFELRCYDYVNLGGELVARPVKTCYTQEYRRIITELMSWGGFSITPMC